jgi:hypothetical protein
MVVIVLVVETVVTGEVAVIGGVFPQFGAIRW